MSKLRSTLGLGKKKKTQKTVLEEIAEDKKVSKNADALDKKAKEDKIIKTSIHYPRDLHLEMKVKAAKEGITIREYIIGLIERDLMGL